MSTKREEKWRLNVAYELVDYEWGSIDEELKDLAGGYSDGAGTGFGMRDMDWYFDSHEEGLAAKDRMENSGLKIGIAFDHVED